MVTGLPVRVVSRHLVKASDATIQPHVLTLSHIDLHADDVQTTVTCVYPNPAPSGAGDFAAVVATFTANLPSFLSHLFFLTGRIATNPASGLLEVRCHNQGAELVVADVGVTLGSLDWGNAGASLNKIQLPYAAEVVMSVQLLSFACGCFAVVWATNHLLGDGHIAVVLLRSWSELALTGTFAGGLNLDRSVLSRPRSPPMYSAAVDGMFVPWDHEHEVNPLTAEASFVERLYYVEAADIARLREEATAGGGKARATSVQAVSAYLWKKLAAVVSSSASIAKSDTAARRCSMGYWVDLRWRVRSPELRRTLSGYVGNATTYVEREEAADAVLRKPLGEVAAMVREAIAAVDYDERLQETVDWLEAHRPRSYTERAAVGLGSPTLHQTVWASFPCEAADFGFGAAALVLPTSANGRMCSAYLCVGRQPGGDAWIVSAYVWPRLAAALENDRRRVFKPLTAEFLGLTGEMRRGLAL
uniref:Uncharacterized protein n=1 Tax=Oryza nivara TaxID=4536 RepID=A0A0E0G550_ORYNI